MMKGAIPSGTTADADAYNELSRFFARHFGVSEEQPLVARNAPSVSLRAPFAVGM
jgi:hypothetical protein